MFSVAPAEKRKADCDASALEDCLIAMKQQDLQALEELYGQTCASVYGFALSVLKNVQDAEDVMHDLYVSVWAAAQTYSPNGKPMAWIMTITRNLCLQKLREAQKRSDIPQEDWETYISGNEKMSSEDKLILSESMKSLSDEERQIVILHAVAGLKHREIGKFLELPLSTVLSKYRRALKKLRKMYGGEQ